MLGKYLNLKIYREDEDNCLFLRLDESLFGLSLNIVDKIGVHKELHRILSITPRGTIVLHKLSENIDLLKDERGRIIIEHD